MDLKTFLDFHYNEFNSNESLHFHADPLIVAKRFLKNNFINEIAFICAMYAYGNAKMILKTLENMPFDIFEKFNLNNSNLKNAHCDILQKKAPSEKESKESKESFKNTPLQYASFLSFKECENLSFLQDSLHSIKIKNLMKDFDELDSHFPLYRFQTSNDTKIFFKILILLQLFGGIKNVFFSAFKYFENDDFLGFKSKNISNKCNKKNIYNHTFLSCIYFLQNLLHLILGANSCTNGLKFLIGQQNTSSPLKRYNMFLRWMVRSDNVDLGLWDLPKNRLILPLDIHTFNISKKLELLNSRVYNLKSAMIITKKLSEFDAHDPVKYDFALYRIGQLKLLK